MIGIFYVLPNFVAKFDKSSLEFVDVRAVFLGISRKPDSQTKTLDKLLELLYLDIKTIFTEI